MNALRYILPIAIILLALLFFRSRSRQTEENPPTPPAIAAQENKAEGKRILSNLETVFAQAATILASIKDSASAEAAVARLQALDPQVKTALAEWNRLPESLRPKLRPAGVEGYEKLKTLIDQMLSQPGMSEKLKPTTDHLLAQLKTFD